MGSALTAKPDQLLDENFVMQVRTSAVARVSVTIFDMQANSGEAGLPVHIGDQPE